MVQRKKSVGQIQAKSVIPAPILHAHCSCAHQAGSPSRAGPRYDSNSQHGLQIWQNKNGPHPLFTLLQDLHMLFISAEMFFSSSTTKFLPVLRNTRVHVSSFIKTSLIPEAKSSLTPPTPLALAPLSPRCNHWSWGYLYLPLDWDWEYHGDRVHLTHSLGDSSTTRAQSLAQSGPLWAEVLGWVEPQVFPACWPFTP